MPFIGPKASVVLHGSDDLDEGRYGLVIKIYMIFFQELKYLPDAGFNSAGVLDPPQRLLLLCIEAVGIALQEIVSACPFEEFVH